MRRFALLSAAALVSLLSLRMTSPAMAEEPQSAGMEMRLEYIGRREALRGSDAVAVPAGAALVQTTQLLPAAADGTLQGRTAAEQTTQLVTQLRQVLAAGGSRLDGLVRLHVYATGNEAGKLALDALTAALPATAAPAITLVQSRLPLEGAEVAMDAIALADGDNPAGAPVLRRSVRGIAGWPERTHVVRWQSPRVVFISGQAERADSAAEAAKLTMASLHRTLEFLGLTAGDVVQVKTFVTPMKDAAAVEEQISAFYTRNQHPAITQVEWSSSLPIEIEMVAIAPAAEEGEPQQPLTWLTPPGMSASPVFSRLAIARNAGLIYTSGLYGAAGASPQDEVGELFGHLEQVLSAAGSDLRHLAKGTYYVSDNEVSQAFNAIRPAKYDPKRPPAASKAVVQGVGLPGRGITVDMIAVRKPATR